MKIKTTKAKPEEVEAAVTAALQCGYRHIDTAFNYRNEDSIGKSIKKWLDDGGKREDLFVTSKVLLLFSYKFVHFII